MILPIARILEATLAIMALVVAYNSPRHRVFSLWITLSLTYTLASHFWIEPVLSRLPRPFTGEVRWLMHGVQFDYLAINAGFVCVVGEPRASARRAPPVEVQLAHAHCARVSAAVEDPPRG